jgi:hypothetical protein
VSTAFIHKHILSHTHTHTLSRARSLSLQVQNVSTAFIGEHGQATAKLDELEFAVDGLLSSLSLSLSLSLMCIHSIHKHTQSVRISFGFN